MTGTNEKKIAELQKVFKDKWNVEQWGDIHTFLGMRCQYNRSEGGLKLDVEQKIKDMLKRFPELAKLPYKTVPLQPSQVNKELKVGDIKPLTPIDEYLIKEYPKIIGTMIYIAITARPDIYCARCWKAISRDASAQQTPLRHAQRRRWLSAKHYISSTPFHSQAIENLFPVRRIKFRRHGAI